MNLPPSTHLLLIRHAESLNNRYGASVGSDSGLTAQGWDQARRLAEWLANNEPVDVLVSSSLLRARQTADIIAQKLHLPVYIQPGLHETEHPYWEEFPTFAENWGLPESSWLLTLETAPRYVAFRARVVAALRATLDRFGGQRIAIVSHGGTMSTLIRTLVGGHNISVYQDNTAIHKLVWERSRWTLMFMNRAEHIPARGGLASPAAAVAPSPGNFRSVTSQPAKASDLSPRVDHPLSPALIERIAQWVQPQPNEQMLDVTTGHGQLAIALAPLAGQVIAIDGAPELLEKAEMARLSAGCSNLQVRWASVERLPFADGEFDGVLCVQGLHHLPDAAAALCEMVRVCRPQGRILLHDLVGDDDAVKRATQDVIERRRDASHVMLFTEEQLRGLALDAGLAIARAELTDVEQRLDDWLSLAHADEEGIEAVTAMLDAAIEGDAAALHVHRERDGSMAFRQWLLTLLLTKSGAA